MIRKNLILAVVFWCLGPVVAAAQPSSEKILPLDAHFNAAATALELNWFDAQPPRVGSVTVKRRIYGQLGGQSWQVIAEGLGPVMSYTDTTVKPGIAYEYQVLRTARDIVDVGYWLAGTEVPARARRGTAYVIVDESIEAYIAPRLLRFERDLAGDGWQVRRHTVPRGSATWRVDLGNALGLRQWLREQYIADPFGMHSIILVGHVPMMRNKKIGPDGHGPSTHGIDLFYADMDGRWTILQTGEILDRTIPSNFIEMQVGRIDFFNSDGPATESEIRLLRAYFDKNHHWRNALHGDLREAYGNTRHLAVEKAGLRNIVGQENLTTGGHHDVGEEKKWLWGVDFGDWNGARYFDQYANKSVFALNFGSGKQRITSPGNGMQALLAQPWHPVAVGWGARPAWWVHHMALGGTLGDVVMRTVNNGEASKPYRESMDYFPTGEYIWRNPVWINLLGDPTLRAFPLAPPHHVSVTPTEQGMKIAWKASPDPNTRGYQIFHAPSEDGIFVALTGAEPITELAYLDSKGSSETRYMIRAYGLKEVYAGSFFTYSQGAFSGVVTSSEMLSVPEMTLHSTAGQSVPLPDAFNQVTNDRIYAIIEGPARGRLVFEDSGWLYIPPADLTGTVKLRYSVSDALHTKKGTLTITIAP